jgi:murein L,D-transpeptidase YcbB/YkuD
MKFAKTRLAAVVGLIVVAAGAGANFAVVSRNDETKGLRLALNVAANRLSVYEDGKLTKTYKVSVGMKQFQTPAGDYTIRDVTWNPWWHPPKSEWAVGRKPEPPGPLNPMGRVKLNFGPLLYIHGTVDWQSLGQPASHGCVRMRNSDLIELAKLVHKYGSPNVPEGTLAQLENAPTMTRTIRLKTPVRFSAQYDVATISDGFLTIYPDHYGLVREQVRKQVEMTLEEHGIDPRRVNRERLERLLEKSETRRVVMSLDSLVMSQGSKRGDDTTTPEH